MILTTEDTMKTTAADAVSYFVQHGELPRDVPITKDVQEAIDNFDGSCAAEDYLWSTIDTAIGEEALGDLAIRGELRMSR